jgi:hypothetical protein
MLMVISYMHVYVRVANPGIVEMLIKPLKSRERIASVSIRSWVYRRAKIQLRCRRPKSTLLTQEFYLGDSSV